MAFLFRKLSTMAQSRTYSDAIAALNSLQSNFAAVEAVKQSGVRNNASTLLEMVQYAKLLGYEPSDFNRLNIVHVTGTKGKGSTCAFVQSILQQYQPAPISKIGLYTSPHLKSVRERIGINGKPISEDLFTQYFFQLWDRLSSSQLPLELFPTAPFGGKPSYFKFLTLLSFHVFMQENVDTAIYEVGIGGELDSTNIIEKPTVTGVSALGIDHTFMLGNTLTEIAWNKGGIFKPGARAFTVASQPAEGLKELERRATERHTTLTVVEPHPGISQLRLGLEGDFQKENAALAVALAREHLRKLGVALEEDVSAPLPPQFRRGLETAVWPGRCQTITRGSVEWLIDGAHTRESLSAGTKWFIQKAKQTESSEAVKRQRTLIFNQQTRDVSTLISVVYQLTQEAGVHFDHVIFTTNVTWETGYSPDLTSLNVSAQSVDSMEVQRQLEAQWVQLQGSEPHSSVHVVPSIDRAVELVDSCAAEGQPVQVFVTGSLHLVGGLLTVLDSQVEAQKDGK